MKLIVAQAQGICLGWLVDNHSQNRYHFSMTLMDAPFSRPLRILALEGLAEEVRQVLAQLGVDEGEVVEKRHVAPLGDPVSLRIGAQVFSLRSELCRKIRVEAL